MVAGHNINYLPVTVVDPGGYLHGYITGNNQYCTSAKNTLVANPAETEPDSTEILLPSGRQTIRVYPNPTTGEFILELTKTSGHDFWKVDLYNMRGEKVFSRMDIWSMIQFSGTQSSGFLLLVTVKPAFCNVNFIVFYAVNQPVFAVNAS